MSNKRRVAERDHTLMIDPSGLGGAVAVAANALFTGPGEPGPEDDWQFPARPLEEIAGEASPPVEAAPATDKPPRQDRRGPRA